jgi:UDP-glucose:(heptosyl)LPS alpha-1,3-glucosyltransferase
MKGLGFLIKALAGMKREGAPPLKCLVLGRDHQDPYIRLANKEGVGGEVIFAGPTNEPEKYYGAADLLVHPTFYDACSLTLLEALASGLPVITTASNGAGGVIAEGKEGFVISDPRDGRTLAEKISFFSNGETMKQASVAARCSAQNYSLERNWREMRKIIGQVSQNRGKSYD